MNIKTLSPEKWLAKAETEGINMLRCIHWAHSVSGWSHYRYMKNHLLVFIEQGKAYAEIDNKIIELNAGDLLWVPPGVVRRTNVKIKNIQEKDYRLHFNISKGNPEFVFPENNFVLNDAWELLPLFQMLNKAYRNPLKHDCSFLHGLCLALASKCLSLRESSSKKYFSNEQFSEFNSFIIDNANRNISPCELASIVKLSHDYFSRKFKKDCGISPKEFIKRERIHFIANFLLESNLSIKEAACHFGYEDTSYFCRQFREIMKCSPMVHKKKNC